jgi:hypothetical protein
MFTMTVTTAMPVVRAKASAIATNIFVMLTPAHRYRSDNAKHSDVVPKGEYLLRRLLRSRMSG